MLGTLKYLFYQKYFRNHDSVSSITVPYILIHFEHYYLFILLLFTVTYKDNEMILQVEQS